ncbi:MAG: type II toxin-antitoxin system VapC family toxin [Pseudonocardia sp.]|nr:type II toxin-antitoxin system VapC family toxin [Pseudonocardia sp.]
MSSGFLLDTCVLIDLEKVDLGIYADRAGAVSAVTLGELAFGMDVGEDEQRAGRRQLFQQVLDDYEILPYDVDEAKLYGVMATLVRAVGRNPRTRRLDLQIAATAAAAHLPLLTCNPKDFLGVERLVKVVPLIRVG